MPVSTNTEFLSKNIRVQNIDGSKSAFIYYEEDQLKISHVNPDPLSIPTFQGFQFDLSNKSEFYAGESMTSIYIYFDSTIGSSTTISSQNGTISGISPFGPTHFYFNYFNSSITDNITITSYNSNNTKFKTEVIPITLKTTQAIPLSFTNALTTQNYTYSNVNISFNKAVKSIGSIVSSNNPNQTITFSTNDTTTVTLTNYTTPQTTSDTLTFVNVIDTNNIANTGNVTLTIQNLQVGPRFQSLVGSNTLISQSYEYLDLEAHFTKDIIQNPDPSKPITITASDGNSHYNIPNTIRIENGNIKFNWITPAISSVTLAFNNLYSTDGTYDDGVAESIVFTLSEPPHTPVWFANQPVNLNTQYTDVEVSFNKRIQSATLGTGNIQSVNIKGVNSRGNFVFDVLTGGVQPSFQFFNIVAEDEGRNAGPINLSLGAYITSVTNATGNSDNKVLIKSDPQAFSITFNKSISNDPTLTVNGGGSATLASKSNDDKTLHYNLTNISASSNLLSFGSVYASDGTTTSNLTYTIVPVNALNFVHISDTSNSLLSKSNFDQNTTYDLYANFTNQTLNLNLNGVNVTSTNGDTVGAITSVIDENKYRFSFTPTTSGTTKLNINNALDVNNFYYPLFQSGLLNINAAFEFSIASGSVTYTQPTGQTFFYPLILDSSTVVTTPYFANWDGVRLLSPGLPSDGSYGFCGNSININGDLVATIAANYGRQIQPKTIRVKTYTRGDTPWQYFKLFGSNTLSDLNNTGIISNTMIQVGPTFENVLTEQDIIDGKTFQLVAAEGRDMYFNLQPVLNTTYQYWTFYFIVRPGYNGALSLHTIEFME